MKKTKKALTALVIACIILTIFQFNALAANTISTRLAGNTAVQTSQAVAQDGWTTSLNAVIAPAATYNMLDTLAAAPLAAALNAPVLLTDGDQLSAEAEVEITRLGVKTVYVASGLAVIRAGVIADLQGLGVTVVNLGGFDQYETSVNIAKEIAKLSPTTSIFIANGETARVAQDALSVAAIAGAQKQPLLLTQKGQLPKVVADYINSIRNNVTTSYITGGTGVVSDAVKAQLPGAVYRNAGLDAYDTNLEVLKSFTTLDYTRIFVANGETMIDAFVGAPLAAQSKSPIILVNGSVKTATTDFLQDKVTVSTVVTALGGTAVVPENLRTTLANPDQLNVTAVAGTTSNLYVGRSNPVLKFTVGGVEKTASELATAGYTVEFQASQPIFYGDDYDSPDGIVNMGVSYNEFTLDEGATFIYRVVLSKGETVITSASQKVTVKAAGSGSNTIESAKIFLTSDSAITGEEVEIKSGTLTLDDDAYLRVRGTNSNDEYGSITKEVKYSSTDSAIAYVDKNATAVKSYNGFDYAKIVLGAQTGSVTITITTSGGSKQTLVLKVVDETRKVSSSKTEITKPSRAKLGGRDTSEAFAVTVNDQFGDPIKGYQINPKDAISGSGTIAQAVAVEYNEATPVGYDADVADVDAITDYKGRVIVLVKGGADDGTATLMIKDKNFNTLGSLVIDNHASHGSSTDYEFTIAPFRTGTLDASDSVDNVTYVNIDAYDSLGYKTSGLDFSNLTIKIDGEKIVNDNTNKYVAVDVSTVENGYIKVTAKKVKSGFVTIDLYQGGSSIKLASITLTVTDTRTKITSVAFQSSIPTIYSASGIKLDKVLKESGIETDDGKPVTFEYVDSYNVLIHGVDDAIIGNLKLSVIDGDLHPTFSNTSGDIKINLPGSDDGENGTIRLTVNRLNGADIKGVPGTATNIGSQNISVTDLANSVNQPQITQINTE